MEVCPILVHGVGIFMIMLPFGLTAACLLLLLLRIIISIILSRSMCIMFIIMCIITSLLIILYVYYLLSIHDDCRAWHLIRKVLCGRSLFSKNEKTPGVMYTFFTRIRHEIYFQGVYRGRTNEDHRGRFSRTSSFVLFCFKTVNVFNAFEHS
jgi:hypothetical protein